jgi:GNAT superfamily N-acetyltransferase
MTFEVRNAVRTDGPQLVALVRGLNEHQGDPTGHFDAATLERDVFGPEAYVGAIVADSGSKLIGYAFFHDAYDSGHAQRGFYLLDIYVAADARRHGVGRALVAGVAKRARSEGRPFLWWVSRDWNDEARKFYATLGVKTKEVVVAQALTFSEFVTLANEGDA